MTLDACVTSGVLPFALRASIWLFKIAPGDFVAGMTSLFRAAVEQTSLKHSNRLCLARFEVRPDFR